MASIWAYMYSKLIVNSKHLLCLSIPKFTGPLCPLHKDSKIGFHLSLYMQYRLDSNYSLCPSIPKFTNLICSVHQDPTRPKVASIWACICKILRVHSNHSLCLSIPKFTDLLCPVHQDPGHQKVASIWAYMCSVPQFTYLIYSVVYIKNWPYMFSTPRIKPSKSGFHLGLNVQYT